jgi:hypothetical protein
VSDFHSMPLVQDFGPRRAARAAFIVRPMLACAAAIAAAAFTMTDARGDEPRWHDFPARRNFSSPRLGVLLSDIEAHLWPGHPYQSGELVNWAHEGTHGLNSNVHDYLRGNGNINAFYVGEGKAASVQRLFCPKAAVAQYVPAEFRDSTLSTYVLGMPAYANEPLYLLDEWTAYSNGTAVAIELSRLGYRLQERESVENMLEFSAFACGILMMIDERIPQYSDKDALAAFIGWGLRRAIDLGKAAQSIAGLASARGAQMIAALEAEFIE